MVDVQSISDDMLLEQCERFGREALLWKNKFRALLPEVERRKLYRKKGYRDIFEFGMRLAGLSEMQISESLNIAPRLEGKPMLKRLLESGEVSVNKIVRIMPIVTSENESALAEKVQLLSLSALKTFVRDVKLDVQVDQKPEGKTLFVQEQEVNEFGLNEQVTQKLKQLQQKGIDINKALLEFLDQREGEITEAKTTIAESLPETSGRYIPVRVKKLIQQEYGAKCAKQNCTRLSQQMHHTARFGVTQSHDPHYLAPLCREHHQIAHMIDVQYAECRKC